MATFLLAWNPKQWLWDNIEEMSQAVRSGQLVITRWSCGKSKSLQNGDRVFFIKLGQEPKGIFASGNIIQGSYEDIHWNEEKMRLGKTAMFVRVRLDILLNPNNDDILPRELLEETPFSAMHWNTQMSGIKIPDEIALDLEKAWANFVDFQSFTSPEEVTTSNILYEGGIKKITVNSYERNLQARKECLEYYGTSCFVCGFDFGEVFGELGDGFIHVHHLCPLSEITEEYEVNPIKDLRPVCPNCHAMIHRRSPPLTIEDVKELLKKSCS